MSDDDKSPVDQMADLFVYAPIGLFFEGPTLVSKLAEQGRGHARTARFVGELAVRQGEAEVRKRWTGIEEQATSLLRGLGLITEPEPAAEPSAGEDADGADGVDGTESKAEGPLPKTKAAPAGAGAATMGVPPPSVVGGVPRADDLAIPGYDSLSASQVVSRLPGLTLEELAAVRSYETAHRGRKTILAKVAQLQP